MDRRVRNRTNRPGRTCAVAAVAVVILLAGCGSPDQGSTPRVAILTFTRAMDAGDWVTACSTMTHQEQAAIGHGFAAACPAALALAMRFGSGIVGKPAMSHLVDGLNGEPLRVAGDRASARSGRGTMILRRINGRWLIASGFALSVA